MKDCKKMVFKMTIEGNIVTRIAREMYFIMHKSYEETENLLLSVLKGTDLSQEELKSIANKILMGELKLKGNTGEYLYLEKDNFNPSTDL